MADQSASPEYWEHRYAHADIPWDIGYPSPALMHYALQWPKDTRIIIPGSGLAWEAQALHEAGFTCVYLCDWAPSAFQPLLSRCPDFPRGHLLVQDFFVLEGSFDLLLEQTFFCAILPSQRREYVSQAFRMLQPHGTLAGVLFDRSFPDPGPPFGGNREAYRDLFSQKFDLITLEANTLSIPPRMGTELFLVCKPQRP